MKRTALTLVILSLLPLLIFAQNETFRHISHRDGLPSGYLHTMKQDSSGFIWLGTDGGLGKFDGYSSKIYSAGSSDDNSLQGFGVYDILEYDRKTLFMTTDFGLNVFHKESESFRLVSLPDSITIPNVGRSLALENPRSIWYLAGGGIVNIDPQTVGQQEVTLSYYALPDDLVFLNMKSHLVIDNASNVWIATQNSLLRFDIATKTFIPVGITITPGAAEVLNSFVWDMAYTQHNGLLISSQKGLLMLDEASNTLNEVTSLGDLKVSDLRNRTAFQSIWEDSDGTLWLGTGEQGAIEWNRETGNVRHVRQDQTAEESIVSNDIHAVFKDNQGNIWFGYHSIGVSVMSPQSWRVEQIQPFPNEVNDYSGNRVFGASTDAQGNLLLGTPLGLVRYDIKEGKSRLYGFSEESGGTGYMQAITATEMWGFAQFSSVVHLIRFNSSKGVLEKVPAPKDFTPTRMPFATLGNTVLIPSATKSLFSYDLSSSTFSKQELRTESEDDRNKSIRWYSFPVKGAEGRVMVMSVRAGIGPNQNYTDWKGYLYNAETSLFEEVDLNTPENIEFNMIPTASNIEEGVVWLPTTMGVLKQNYLTGETKVLFGEHKAAIRTSSFYLLEDQKGMLWMTYSLGVLRMNPNTDEVRYFKIEDERFLTIGGAALLNTGEIVFPGNMGFIKFDPENLQEVNSEITLHLTHVRAGEQDFNVLYEDISNYELASSENNISFTYLGLYYKEPQSTQYRYRLKGYNDDWVEVGKQRSVFLANLPYGDFTFQVQAAKDGNVFSGDIAEQSFTILPPWWRTTVAYFGYGILFIGLFVAGERVQRRRVLRQERDRNREKELAQAKEIERAYEHLKAAKDQLVQQEKLASLGQLTAGIAHEIKNPLNFVTNFSELSVELVEETKEELLGISENVSKEDREKISEALIILEDIKSNVSKIHTHGTRADSIVKAMLQHSKGSDGKKEPTDLNALVKEYMNLSYHGMRAGKNPIDVDVEFDLDDAIGEVPLIAEDFSRVIVNLTNNAFDACAEKLSALGSQLSAIGGQPLEALESTKQAYAPKVRITTKLIHNGGKVANSQQPTAKSRWLIAITDNGPGIPDDIKDKILQPFFTTKKGTEGTGLGLSITNDIVKAHGGNIEIESAPEGGTTLKITLPHD